MLSYLIDSLMIASISWLLFFDLSILSLSLSHELNILYLTDFR